MTEHQAQDIHHDGKVIGRVRARDFTSVFTGKTKTLWDHQIPGYPFAGGHATRADAVDVLLRVASQAAAS